MALIVGLIRAAFTQEGISEAEWYISGAMSGCQIALNAQKVLCTIQGKDIPNKQDENLE